MLSVFPNFKTIEISDKPLLDQILKDFLPYSDFNFVSLFSWNTDGETQICTLNNNLVIKLKDYTSTSHNFSFIGKNEISKTVDILLEYISTFNLHSLQLIPEEVISANLISEEFQVTETPIQNDYVLDINKLSEMSGSEFHKKRNLYKKFEKENLAFIKVLDKVDDKYIQESEDLFRKWANIKQKNISDYEDELKAFKNALTLHDNSLTSICLYIDDQLMGFAVCEIINNDYIMIHFEKTDPTLSGISEYLMKELTNHFKKQNLKYINYQQDLGIEGLRRSKLSYRPIRFLKKYSISTLQTDKLQ